MPSTSACARLQLLQQQSGGPGRRLEKHSWQYTEPAGYDRPGKLHQQGYRAFFDTLDNFVELLSKSGFPRPSQSSLSMCDPTPRRVMHVGRSSPGRALEGHIII